MKARLLYILLACAMLFYALSLPASAVELPFSDVADSAWYYESVERVYREDWMKGTSTSTFTPNGPLTRAMLSVILWRIEGCPEVGRSAVFTDTAPDDWFAEGLSWCVGSGVFAGFQDGGFRPQDSITREQLATVFYRYAGQAGREPVGDKRPVTIQSGCAWAADACAWAYEHGLFTDALGALNLCAPASRGEIAYLLDQYFPSEASPSALTENSFDSMGYLLYTPANAQPDMPLIVYLHGGHGKGSDLSVLTTTDGFPQYLADELLGEVPAYVLIPQLPEDQRGWKPASETVMRLIDKVCEENRIDRSRVSLTGHSMGGTGTWDLALLYPDAFSRIAPMSGSVDTTASTLAAFQNTPVWAFVGEDDVVVKPESSEQFVAMLERQNPDAKITVFPETDHVGVPQKAWLEHGGELLKWLLG